MSLLSIPGRFPDTSEELAALQSLAATCAPGGWDDAMWKRMLAAVPALTQYMPIPVPTSGSGVTDASEEGGLASTFTVDMNLTSRYLTQAPKTKPWAVGARVQFTSLGASTQEMFGLLTQTGFNGACIKCGLDQSHGTVLIIQQWDGSPPGRATESSLSPGTTWYSVLLSFDLTTLKLWAWNDAGTGGLIASEATLDEFPTVPGIPFVSFNAGGQIMLSNIGCGFAR
jgi:hypothetical protein